MTKTLQITKEAYDKLEARAKAKNVTLPEYITQLVLPSKTEKNMTKITIPYDLAGNLQVYAKCCMPEKTIDQVAAELLQLGIDTLNMHLSANKILKSNPNTQ